MPPDDRPPELPERRRGERREAPPLPGSLFRRIYPQDLQAHPDEVAIEVVRNRRLLRRLFYGLMVGLAALMVLGLIVGHWIKSRDENHQRSDDVNHAFACVILRNVTPTPPLEHYLRLARKTYPDCPKFTPHPTPTVTRTVDSSEHVAPKSGGRSRGTH